MYSITDLHKLTLKKFLYMNLLCGVVGTGFTEAMIESDKQLLHYSQQFMENLDFSNIRHSEYVVLQLKNLVNESRERDVTVINNLCLNLKEIAGLGGDFAVDPYWQDAYTILVKDLVTKTFDSFVADYKTANEFCKKHLGSGGYHSLDTYRNILQIAASPGNDFNYALTKHCFHPWRVLPIVKTIVGNQGGNVSSAEFLLSLEDNADYKQVCAAVGEVQNCGHPVRVIDLPREALNVPFLRNLSLHLNENDPEQCYYFAALVMMNWFANITSASGTICKHKPKSEGSDPELILSVNFYTQQRIHVIGGDSDSDICRLFFAIHKGSLFATFYPLAKYPGNNEVDQKFSWSILKHKSSDQYYYFSGVSAGQTPPQVNTDSDAHPSRPGQIALPAQSATSIMETPQPSDISSPADFERTRETYDERAQTHRGGYSPRGGRGNRRGRGRQQQRAERDDSSRFNYNVLPEPSLIDTPKIESGKGAEAVTRTADPNAPVSTSNNAKAPPKKTKKQLDEEARLAKLKELEEKRNAAEAAKALKKEQQRQKELERRAKRQEEEKHQAEALLLANEREAERRKENERKMAAFVAKQAERKQEKSTASGAEQQPSEVSQPKKIRASQQIIQNATPKQGNNVRSTAQNLDPNKRQNNSNDLQAKVAKSGNKEINSTQINAQNSQDPNTTQPPTAYNEICREIASNLENIGNYIELREAQFNDAVASQCACVKVAPKTPTGHEAKSNLATNVVIYLSELSKLTGNFKQQANQKKKSIQINITKLLAKANKELRKNLTDEMFDALANYPGLPSNISTLLSNELTLAQFCTCVEDIHRMFHEFFLLLDFSESSECICDFNSVYGDSITRVIEEAEKRVGFDVTEHSVARFVKQFWGDFSETSADTATLPALIELFEKVQYAYELNGSLLDNISVYDCQFTYIYLNALLRILKSADVDSLVANLTKGASVMFALSIMVEFLTRTDADVATKEHCTDSILTNPSGTLRAWFPKEESEEKEMGPQEDKQANALKEASISQVFLDPWIRTFGNLQLTNVTIQDLASYVLIIGSIIYQEKNPKNLLNFFKIRDLRNLLNRKITVDPTAFSVAVTLVSLFAGFDVKKLNNNLFVTIVKKILKEQRSEKEKIYAVELGLISDEPFMMNRLLELGATPNIIMDHAQYSTYFSELLLRYLLVLRQNETSKKGLMDLTEQARLKWPSKHSDTFIKMCIRHGAFLNNPIDPRTNQPFYPEQEGIPLVFAINADRPEILKLLLDSYSQKGSNVSELLLSLHAEEIPVLANLTVEENSLQLQGEDCADQWLRFLNDAIEGFEKKPVHISLVTYSLWRAITGIGDFKGQWSLFELIEPFVNATNLLEEGFQDYIVGSALITNAACILFKNVHGNTVSLDIDALPNFRIVKKVVDYALKIMQLYFSIEGTKKAFLDDTVKSLKKSGEYIVSKRLPGHSDDNSGIVDALIIKIAGLMGLSQEECRRILEATGSHITDEEGPGYSSANWGLFVQSDASDQEEEFNEVAGNDKNSRKEDQQDSQKNAPVDYLALEEMNNPLADFSFGEEANTNAVNHTGEETQEDVHASSIEDFIKLAEETNQSDIARMNNGEENENTLPILAIVSGNKITYNGKYGNNHKRKHQK